MSSQNLQSVSELGKAVKKKLEENTEQKVEQKESSGQVIFWSKASKLSIANFVKEVISAGRIVQPERSVYFNEHIFITSDPRKIEHIRQSNSFECGDARECDSIEDAHKLTRQQNAVKQVKELKAEAIESTIIK